MRTHKLKAGTRVVFTAKSGNNGIKRIYVIESSEEHGGVTFYRLAGEVGSLWMRSSLATTKRKNLDT